MVVFWFLIFATIEYMKSAKHNIGYKNEFFLFSILILEKMSQFFTFVLGLLKPYPESWQNVNEKSVTALQRAGKNKLLDLNVLCIIQSYMGTPFYFTSQDVKIEQRVIIANDLKNTTLQHPTHLCELSDGCVAVVEGYNGGLIRIFRGDTLVQSIGSGIISKPYGICTNSSDQLIVTDDGKNQVHMFSRDGSHMRSFGSHGSGDGQLNNPSCVCVNLAGYILVADCCNDRICIFNHEGKFLRELGKGELGDGELTGPVGVCVDGKDNVYVIDLSNIHILKFSANGKFMRKFVLNNINVNYQPFFTSNIYVTCDGKYIIIANYKNQLQVISELDNTIVASYRLKSNNLERPLFAACFIVTSDGRILISENWLNCIYEIRKV
jgi:hypothetical protein